MRIGLRRAPVASAGQSKVGSHTFPAPTRGWVTNENLSNSTPGSALVLDNYIPTQTGVKFRGGSDEYFDSTNGVPIKSLFTYKVSGNSELFAAEDASIWDITSTATAVVTGQTGGEYSTIQFETSGGSYLFAANGEDSLQRYDGTTWLAITGVSTGAITGVTTSTLSQTWAYKNRLFFVEGGTMKAWFLSVDSISGAANDLTLAGVFQKGGSLLFGATWSIDAGDGVDDKCVFVSTQGEIAIYEGSDPADPADWALVGRYELGGRPLGKNATMRAGGDLLIATTDGLVPLSAALSKDPAALSLAAVSRNIQPDWRREAVARQSTPWSVQKWDEENLAVIGLPVTDTTTDAVCFVVNTETGAWSRFTGWDVRSLAVHDDQIYFGTSDGRVLIGNTTGSDDGSNYVCRLALPFDHFRQPGRHKTLKQARATFRASSQFLPQLSCSVDYAQSFPAAPSSVANYAEDTWDVGVWDTAVWDASSTESVTSTRWVSIVGSGFAHAIQLQVTFGITPTPDAELQTIDCTFEVGSVVN